MRAEISPSTYLHPSASLRSKLWKEQHKRHRVYTGSGHRCGVIPYSSVVWWIASWAKDEQLQGKNNLLRRGALVLGECGGFGGMDLVQDEIPLYGGG